MNSAKEKTPQEIREEQLVSEVNKIIKDYANSNSELRDLLNQLTIQKVKEFSVKENNKVVGKALLVYLPFAFHKKQPQAVVRLMSEIKKKKSVQVFMTALRTVVHPRSGYKQKIPRSRTLTAVYESLLDDLISPADILGKRIRHQLGGNQAWKVQLNVDNKGFLQPRLSAIRQIYAGLTKRNLVFEFIEEPNYKIIPKLKTKSYDRKKMNRKERRKADKPN
jgi:small subunit ribosomal protein S7e